jgi:glycosyltransferase involved in cell wall biosynthesis
VTTSIAGAARVVTEARAGIIVADASPPALRQAIRTLAQDKELRREMGARGPSVATRFGVDAHAAHVVETYRLALQDADPRRN